MNKLKTKQFKISDLFVVSATKSLDESNLTFVEDGINFVGRVKENNGIKGKIKKQNFEPNEPNSITATVIGNYKYVKYQEEPYYCSQNINKLIPKFEMNRYSALYMITFIQKFVSRFDRQRDGYKLDDLKNCIINLPVCNMLCPDFERIQNIVLRGGDVDMTTIDTSSWKEFIYSDLFELKTIGKKLDKLALSENGTVPVYSSDTSNNGIIGYTEEKPTFVVDENNPIYLIFGDHTRTMNIATSSFCVMDNVKVLKPKFNSIEVLLFIITMWKKGIRDLGYARHWSIAKEVVFKLPVKEEEVIDIQYMEQFIMDLEKVHLMDLERYLRVAGLEDTMLSDKEKFVLENTALKKSFKISDLFTIENTDSYNTDALVDGNNYDYITRTVLNNGINRTTGFISEKGINEVGSFSLELMNMTFFYRESEWYAGQFVRKVKFKYEINELRALYLLILLRPVSQILKSVLIRNVDKTFLNLQIDLPIKENGDIDFEYMETYIKAFEKLTIQKIYDNGSIFIDKTRQLIENK